MFPMYDLYCSSSGVNVYSTVLVPTSGISSGVLNFNIPDTSVPSGITNFAFFVFNFNSEIVCP